MATLTWNIVPYIFPQFLDDNGDPLAGGLLYHYAAGMVDTDKDVYYYSTGTTKFAQPIVLDAGGRIPGGAMWLSSGAYKFVLTDSEGTQIGDIIDNVTGAGVGEGTISIVETIDDLKALDEGITDIVFIEGYYAANDGGGGYFYWDSTSSGTDDGGAIILPDTAPSEGRWLRIFDDDINVYAFGATGNGTTDDSPFFVTANAYADTNNKQLLINAGTYLWSSDPSLTVPLRFNQNAVLLWTSLNPVIQPIIEENDNSQHFDIDIDDEPIFNTGITVRPQWFGAVADGTTDDTIAVSNAGNAIPDGGGTLLIPSTEESYLVGSDTGYVITAKSNMYIKGSGEKSLFTFADSATSDGIIGHTPATALTNIRIENIAMNGNKAENSAGTGIFLDCNGGYIRNCKIDDFYDYGIRSTCINFTIENNMLSANKIFIQEAEKVRILNNNISATTAETMGGGIDLVPGANLICTDVDIIGNTLIGCIIAGLGATASSHIIDRINIYDNFIDLSRTDLGGTSNPACILIYTATGEVHIARNKCYPNTEESGIYFGDPDTVIACQYDISDNIIRMTDLTAGTNHNGITLKNVSSAVIDGNHIYASSSTGNIHAIEEKGTCTNIKYGRNEIVNFTDPTNPKITVNFNERFGLKDSGDIASANNLSLGQGSINTITGTTTVNLISNLGWIVGGIALLEFDDAVTIKHNYAPSETNVAVLLKAEADKTTDTETVMLLKYDGTNFIEIVSWSTAGGSGRLFQTMGENIASAGTITLSDANYFIITGTTQIDYMTTTGWTAGSIVYLQAASTGLVFNHNTGSVPPNTAAFFCVGEASGIYTYAGYVYGFVYDGTYWRICVKHP
jgi:hypothetical protein